MSLMSCPSVQFGAQVPVKPTPSGYRLEISRPTVMLDDLQSTGDSEGSFRIHAFSRPEDAVRSGGYQAKIYAAQPKDVLIQRRSSESSHAVGSLHYTPVDVQVGNAVFEGYVQESNGHHTLLTGLEYLQKKVLLSAQNILRNFG